MMLKAMAKRIAESNGEEDADTESDDRLPAEITLHTFLHVVEHTLNERTLCLWHQTYKSNGEFLVVHENEEKVDDTDERCD